MSSWDGFVAEWGKRRLAEVVELRRGFDLPHRERRDGPYPVLSAGSIAGWHAEGRVEGPGFAIGRATNLGKPTWSESDYWPLNTTLYVADFNGNNRRWAFHLFETLDLTGFDSGSVQPMLNRNYIADLEVVVPPQAEQQAIAEVLGALDDKIAANARLIENADALAAAHLSAALSKERAPLERIATVTMGSSPPGSSYNESGDGAVLYQGIRDFGMRVPTPRVWTTSPVRFAAAGDSLVSVRAPVGEVNLANGPVCIGRGLAAVRSTTGAPMTLFHLLRHIRALWEPFQAEGTVFGSINRKQLAGLEVPSVHSDVREQLETSLAGIERRIASALRENDSLVAMRDALLPALMSGRLRVREAEELVADVV